LLDEAAASVDEERSAVEDLFKSGLVEGVERHAVDLFAAILEEL